MAESCDGAPAQVLRTPCCVGMALEDAVAELRQTVLQDIGFRWGGWRGRRDGAQLFNQLLQFALQGELVRVHIGHEAHGAASRLDALARSMGVKLCVHGHHHDALDSRDQWERQGFKSFGVGQASVTAIDLDGYIQVLIP